MNGAIADPAVRTISTPKASKITISGSSQNFFLSFRKPQRSLMNSIISFAFLVRFFYVLSSECMISNNHYRIVAGLEALQFQRINPEKFPCQANRGHHAKENQR